jgi:hypothetical protein
MRWVKCERTMEDCGMKEIVQRHPRKVRKKRFQYASRVSGLFGQRQRTPSDLAKYLSVGHETATRQ